jgi:hypothetical protein
VGVEKAKYLAIRTKNQVADDDIDHVMIDVELSELRDE